MSDFTLVTGNPNKLKAWRRIMPARFNLQALDLNLTEIQPEDPADTTDLVDHKLMQAYRLVGGPVAIEDVSAGLDKFNGLPGPYIKSFEQKIGKDALYVLAGEQESAATVCCIVAYYDGENTLSSSATIHGTVVAPRGDNGFGFDIVFQPEGYDITFAEMSPEQKDTVGYRRLAIDGLVKQLDEL